MKLRGKSLWRGSGWVRSDIRLTARMCERPLQMALLNYSWERSEVLRCVTSVKERRRNGELMSSCLMFPSWSIIFVSPLETKIIVNMCFARFSNYFQDCSPNVLAKFALICSRNNNCLCSQCLLLWKTVSEGAVPVSGLKFCNK